MTSNSRERKAEQGEVWIGVTDRELKSRPLLVISKQNFPLQVLELDVNVMPITSQLGRDHRDVPIDWERVGLNKASVVRTGKITTTLSSNLKYKVGKLSEADLTKVLEVFKSNF